VKTGDTSILIQEYEIPSDVFITPQVRLGTSDILPKTWLSLPN